MGCTGFLIYQTYFKDMLLLQHVTMSTIAMLNSSKGLRIMNIPVTVWAMMLREGLLQKIYHLHHLHLDHHLHQDRLRHGIHTLCDLDSSHLCSQNCNYNSQKEMTDFKKYYTPCSHWACSDWRGCASFPKGRQPHLKISIASITSQRRLNLIVSHNIHMYNCICTQ